MIVYNLEHFKGTLIDCILRFISVWDADATCCTLLACITSCWLSSAGDVGFINCRSSACVCMTLVDHTILSQSLLVDLK